jgi:hypothetical protein
MSVAAMFFAIVPYLTIRDLGAKYEPAKKGVAALKRIALEER